MKNATNKAILSILNIRTYTARKLDKSVSLELNRAKHAASDASRVNKLIIPKENLRAVSRAVNALRTAHYTNTLPFSQGAQLLPMANYETYRETISELIIDAEKAARDFVVNYPLLKQSAPRRLGDLYNYSDFPPVEVIADKFSFSLSFQPVADAGQFSDIFGISENEKYKIAAEYSKQLENSYNDSMRAVYERLYKAIQHMSEKLHDREAVFRESLTNNISELIELLPRLNINNETTLTERIKEARELIKYSGEQLRENPVARENTAKQADAILSKMAGYL